MGVGPQVARASSDLDRGDFEPNRSLRGRHARLIGLSAALAIALLVLAVAVWPRHKATVKFCAGVGLNGPVAATPDEALAAWLDTPYVASSAPPVAAWRRTSTGSDGPVAYDNTKAVDGAYRYRSVQLEELDAAHAMQLGWTAGGWSVQGACV